MLGWLDAWVLRRPFEGSAARHYQRRERPAFGNLDQRVLAALDADLAGAHILLDVGAGAGELSRRAAARPGLKVLAVEPSRTFTRTPWSGVTTLRAWAEALPLARGSVDVALCLSSLRHVRDRAAALRELRRVVRPGGAAWIVELDREAGASRVHRHAAGMQSRASRLAFRLLVLPTCPPAARYQALASAAGWRPGAVTADPEQPFFLLRLS